MGMWMVWMLIFMMLSLSVKAFEHVCTFTASNGDYYDLSPLSDCSNIGLTVGVWQINICNSITACSDPLDSMICHMGFGINSGDVNNYNFTDLSEGDKKGVVLQTGAGDTEGCPNNIERSSTITLLCDETSKEPNITFIGESPQCHYNFEITSIYACPVSPETQIKNCPVYVYLVPHTHDDAGWLMTIEQYYSTEVKHILDTVVSNLYANPERTFIYVEQVYFWMWWTDSGTTDDQRNQFHKIYSNGQFEFVIGGWVMQDEGCTTYGSDIDQMTLGHQFLLSTFGARPTKGWQIDPFGASSVTPTLNKLAGFDAHVIDRISNKVNFQDSQMMQFLWQGSPSLGEQSEIFTEILTGYCDWFSIMNFGNDPVNPSNVALYAKSFYTLLQSVQSNYLTNHILAEWGCDFAFQNATAMFHSMDILMEYLQNNEKNTGVIVNYNTLSEYFAGVQGAGIADDINWPKNKGNDFFPINQVVPRYWSGYFTSRPQLKGTVRQGEAAAHAAELAFTMGTLQSLTPANFSQNLWNLRKANADAQHHDGITGTSYPVVVDMFANDIINAMAATNQDVASTISAMTSYNQTAGVFSANYSVLLDLQPDQTVVLLLFNSLAWTRSDYVALPINVMSSNICVYGGTSLNLFPAQINPNYMEEGEGKYTLFFQASVGPLDAGYYEIRYETAPCSTTELALKTSRGGADEVIENEFLSITFSGETGRMSNITNKMSNISVGFDQNIMAYISEHSGAYVFAPKSGGPRPVSLENIQTTVVTGSLVNEVYQVFPCEDSMVATQTIRLYQSGGGEASVGDFFELNFQIGSLPPQYEVITSFQTSIGNGQTFYTDDNGFEFVQRQNQFSNLVGGNYYPLVYSSYIEDELTQLTVIADRAHGCSSQMNGGFEVMIHRNPNMSDYLGPSLTDASTAFPKFRIAIETPEDSKLLARQQPYLLNNPLVPLFSLITNSDRTSPFATPRRFLEDALPPNIHLLSFNTLENGSIILRLTHLFAEGEHPTYSKPVTVNLSNVLGSYTITNISETTLTANNVLSSSVDGSSITLTAKQIRTFVLFVVHSNLQKK